jgi:formylmethanofuran dehydrogenase subunit E
MQPIQIKRRDIKDLTPFLEQTALLHKHLCPRQVLGVRIGLHAGELLGVEVPQEGKRLFAFVEADGCFADGVSVASGCWLGHRTLRLVDIGKAAATFVDTETDRAIRISPHPHARERAAVYAPGAQDTWHAQREAYQVMPVEELLVARPVTLTVSMRGIISRPGLRVPCACCGEEIMNEREVVVEGRVLCRTCAGLDRYYTDDRR